MLVGDDGRAVRREAARGVAEPAAAGRRATLALVLGVQLGEGGLRASLRVAVDSVLLHNERVRRVVARAGATCAHVQWLGLCCVRTGCDVGWSALRVRALRMGDVQ
eukprot:3707128-Prymnesium_polylepis.1